MAAVEGDTQILLGVDIEHENVHGFGNPAMHVQPRLRHNVKQELEDVNDLVLNDDKTPRPALWEDVIQENEEGGEDEGEEDENLKGNCCVRCLRGCGKCFNEAWAGCTPVDKALLFMHIIIGICSMGQIVALANVKIMSHNQCLLRGVYYPDGTMTTGDKFWCDSALYYGLISASLVFMFAMVNWTAQLNNNWRWMQLHLVLTIVGTIGQLLTFAMFAMSYMIWCDVLHNSLHCNPSSMSSRDHCSAERQNITTCSQAMEYFDNQLNHDNLLQRVKSYCIVAMAVISLVSLLWIILLGLLINKFCVVSFEVKRKREEEEEENARLEEEFQNQEPYDPTQGPPDEPHAFEIQCKERERRERERRAREQQLREEEEQGEDDGDARNQGEGYQRMLAEDGNTEEYPHGAANNLPAPNDQILVADIHG